MDKLPQGRDTVAARVSEQPAVRAARADARDTVRERLDTQPSLRASLAQATDPVEELFGVHASPVDEG